MSVFNLEEYMSHIYRNIWSDIYSHIQDVLFFTRAELYPVDLSTKDMLTLQLNWLTVDKEWCHREFIIPFDSTFPSQMAQIISKINEILAETAFLDFNCIGLCIGSFAYN